MWSSRPLRRGGVGGGGGLEKTHISQLHCTGRMGATGALRRGRRRHFGESRFQGAHCVAHVVCLWQVVWLQVLGTALRTAGLSKGIQPQTTTLLPSPSPPRPAPSFSAAVSACDEGADVLAVADLARSRRLRQRACKLRKAMCIRCGATKAIRQQALLGGLNVRHAVMPAGSEATSHLQACAVDRGGSGTAGHVLRAVTLHYRCALW